MISKAARIIEIACRLVGMRNLASKNMRNPKRHRHDGMPPKRFDKRYRMHNDIINNHLCVTLQLSEKPDKHLFYFHGGAYTVQAQVIHWTIIKKILEKTRCIITFVNYPLAPEFTCVDTIAMVLEAYTLCSKKSGLETILMGDSAGGGLALALAQLLQLEETRHKPGKVILLSPWLDISMDEHISAELEERDVILDKDTLKEVGAQYAGRFETKHAYCSPLYGDMTGIGEIALFTGTSDILHVQAKQLKEVLVKNGQSVSYYEYEQMQHVWVGLPIPEAADAMEQVIAFINQ